MFFEVGVYRNRSCKINGKDSCTEQAISTNLCNGGSAAYDAEIKTNDARKRYADEDADNEEYFWAF